MFHETRDAILYLTASIEFFVKLPRVHGRGECGVRRVKKKEAALGVRILAVTALGVVLGLALSTNAIAAEKKMAKKAEKMVKYVVKDGAIAKSLTGKPGDAKKGRKLAINRKKGNCLACHKMPVPEQPFHGELGPELMGVASRLNEGQIRLRIVDPKFFNRDTIMPAFYKNTGFTRVMKKFKGKTMLSAAQVEDLVAYAMTLK